VKIRDESLVEQPWLKHHTRIRSDGKPRSEKKGQ